MLVGLLHGTGCNTCLWSAHATRNLRVRRLSLSAHLGLLVCLFFLCFSPQREIAEEKERVRKAKEEERLIKLEVKRLEKEARDRERAEQQAREQVRREIEREKARLAKRYPLPDEVPVLLN